MSVSHSRKSMIPSGSIRRSGKRYRTTVAATLRTAEIDQRRGPAAGLSANLLLVATGLLLAVIAATTLAIALLMIYQSDLIMPGVEVSNIALGGRSIFEATVDLEGSWKGPIVQIGEGDQVMSVPAKSLGIILDAKATAQRAHQAGRASSRVDLLLDGNLTVKVKPVWQLDSSVAELFLHDSASLFSLPPLNAGIRMADGLVEATPPVSGRKLDVAATVARMEQDLYRIVAEGRFQPVTIAVQPEVVDVNAALGEAKELLAHTLSVRVHDPITNETVNWFVEPAEWSRWAYLGVTLASPPALLWELDQREVEAFLLLQAATLAPDRYIDMVPAVAAVMAATTGGTWQADLRLFHHPGQHTVRPGDTMASIGREYGIPYPWIQQANPQAVGMLKVGQVVIIPSPDDLLPLPVVMGKRIVVSISQQRLWAYEGDALKWEWLVSTGIDTSPTSPGVFQVQSHEANAYAASWDLWMPYFMGVYRPVPSADFMNGFHGFPTRNGGQLLWTSDLGRPVTYGCILLAQENAAALYECAPDGTVVEIRL